MWHRERHRETGSTGALRTTEQSIRTEFLPAQKKKISQKNRGKVRHRENVSQAAQARRISVQRRLRAASTIQIRSQREHCAKTALLNLPPGWFPPSSLLHGFPPALARSLHLSAQSLSLLCSPTAQTHARFLSLSRPPAPAFARTHALSYLRSLADEINPPPPHLPLRSFSLAFLEIQSSA